MIIVVAFVAVLPCLAQRVTLLPNGWRTGTVVPTSCRTGTDNTFLQQGTNIIFECTENKYVQVESGWRKYTLTAIANTVLGCASVNGCWSINGTLGAIKNGAGLTQQIAIFTMPTNAYVSAFKAKTAVAFTGSTTTVLSDVGNATSGSAYATGLTYNLKSAVSDANLLNPVFTAVGNNTVASQAFTITITNTVDNINTIAAGSSVVLWVKWEQIPQ